MQQTTFNSPYHESVHAWLHELYGISTSDKVSSLFSELNSYRIVSLINLQAKINYSFSSHDILLNALTHSTFCYEFKESTISSNERLEFLGDSLVNFIVAKRLFNLFPHSPEGELSKLRGALVNEQSLAKLARSLNLGENLLLGKGEFKSNGEQKDSLIADAFEALCAAVYIDSNEQMNILENVFENIIDQFENLEGEKFYNLDKLETFDSKTKLQELVMSLYQIHPTYKSIDLENEFLVELWVGDKKLAYKKGSSKKKLEKELAHKVMVENLYQK